MTVKFDFTDGTFMSMNGTVDNCVDVEVWEDGMVCFEFETCDGSQDFTTTIENMEEIVKVAKQFMENRKNKKTAH